MIFSKEFYALNLALANRLHQVTHLPLELALRQYTNLYIRFGLRYALDKHHPVWQEYISGLNRSESDVEWTYTFAMEHAMYPDVEILQPAFGCFSYTVWNEKRIRIHFHNQEEPDISPLSDASRKTRQDELISMFVYIKQHMTGMESVVGGSWLYHLEAYRRLFPPIFLSSARPGSQDYPYLTLWGQFLDRHGQVRPEQATKFTDRLEKQDTLEGILGCFPLNVLYLEAPLPAFLEYYGIG